MRILRRLENLHDGVRRLLDLPLVRPLATMALALGLIFAAKHAIYASVEEDVGRLALMMPCAFGAVLLACALTGMKINYGGIGDHVSGLDGNGDDGCDGGCD